MLAQSIGLQLNDLAPTSWQAQIISRALSLEWMLTQLQKFGLVGCGGPSITAAKPREADSHLTPNSVVLSGRRGAGGGEVYLLDC